MPATRRWAIVGAMAAVSGLGTASLAVADPSHEIKLNDKATVKPAAEVGAAPADRDPFTDSADSPDTSGWVDPSPESADSPARSAADSPAKVKPRVAAADSGNSPAPVRKRITSADSGDSPAPIRKRARSADSGGSADSADGAGSAG